MGCVYDYHPSLACCALTLHCELLLTPLTGSKTPAVIPPTGQTCLVYIRCKIAAKPFHCSYSIERAPLIGVLHPCLWTCSFNLENLAEAIACEPFQAFALLLQSFIGSSVYMLHRIARTPSELSCILLP